MQKVHELGAVSILMDILEIGYFEEDTFNIFLQNLQNLIEFQSQRVMIQETQQMLLEVKTKTKKKKTKFGHQGPEFIEDKNKSNGGGEHQAEDIIALTMLSEEQVMQLIGRRLTRLTLDADRIHITILEKPVHVVRQTLAMQVRAAKQETTHSIVGLK